MPDRRIAFISQPPFRVELLVTKTNADQHTVLALAGAGELVYSPDFQELGARLEETDLGTIAELVRGGQEFLTVNRQNQIVLARRLR